MKPSRQSSKRKKYLHARSRVEAEWRHTSGTSNRELKAEAWVGKSYHIFPHPHNL